jgi:hypothetical protein
MNRKSTEELYEKAEELFKSVPKEEVEAWCKHPVTQSLIQSLYGDMAGHFEGWLNGEFTGKSGDETIQKNSKALGGVSAIEGILVWFDDAEKGELYD